MIFWEVLLERFVGKLCGGAAVILAKNDGGNDTEVMKADGGVVFDGRL